MKELNLKLTLDETNVILTALGNLPYNQVKGLVEKVRAQGIQQVQELNGAPQQIPVVENQQTTAEVVAEQSMN